MNDSCEFEDINLNDSQRSRASRRRPGDSSEFEDIKLHDSRLVAPRDRSSCCMKSRGKNTSASGQGSFMADLPEQSLLYSTQVPRHYDTQRHEIPAHQLYSYFLDSDYETEYESMSKSVPCDWTVTRNEQEIPLDSMQDIVNRTPRFLNSTMERPAAINSVHSTNNRRMSLARSRSAAGKTFNWLN